MINQCFPTGVRRLIWVRKRLWMSPQALRANEFAFKEKELQVTWIRKSTYCPATSGVKAYSHSKEVRAYFPAAWKNARAKALYIAGETMVKPAVVKIVYSDALGNKLAIWCFCQTTPSSGASKNSQSIFWNILLQLLLGANGKSYFRVGRNYRFRKRCTVYSVCAITCDWGLRGTLSLLQSTCQKYYRKGNVQESGFFC